MESAVAFRSFNGACQPVVHAQAFPGKPASVPIFKDASRRCLSFQSRCQRFVITKSSNQASLLPSVKATETASAVTSNGAFSENAPQGLAHEKNVQKLTFPSGLKAFVLGVCDETDVAEVKLKVGQFEMHLKRNTGSPEAPAPFVPSAAPPATPPPVPSKPKAESGPSAPQAAPQKSTSASTNPFANTSSANESKLAALEGSGSNTYVLVSSPTVGLFRSGRTVKGKKQPPSCKEGDIIKEGQVIGYLDQFGSELPIKSDAAGEILKFLFKDGEPVGYGDPLVAVLPAFHGIK
ncbi:uncharacterized protein LOC109822049 [Asparagus officinalis]|uniref:uncharacterized protein LOC109822049 n=1 Tax=Asparagus officinalis TaxID=4686 RepID=UPI00098E0C03|nr:uncharacterized protein LOC109822049 [Asparagus officinalis]